ncbi:hypothetical protein HOK021_01590 [Streptomyces hygroscopicus]|nr:hypothetical protein HOK021_01590 [Streptomyces hygroscopicus]
MTDRVTKIDYDRQMTGVDRVAGGASGGGGNGRVGAPAGRCPGTGGALAGHWRGTGGALAGQGAGRVRGRPTAPPGCP